MFQMNYKEQHALVKYVDDSNGTLLDKEDIQGVTDAAIEHTNDAKIATYRAKGYELVFDELANELCHQLSLGCSLRLSALAYSLALLGQCKLQILVLDSKRSK